MSGIIRNLVTLIFAFFDRNKTDVQSKVNCYFLITPFDCGVSVLKSDKYFQLAESAQIDFLVRTKLLGKLRSEGIGFVNASQMVKFMKPIKMFERVCVETRVVFTDEKFSYFSHSMIVGGQKCGEVLVKMKFKKGSLTVVPADVIGEIESEDKLCLQFWDQALEVMS